MKEITDFNGNTHKVVVTAELSGPEGTHMSIAQLEDGRVAISGFPDQPNSYVILTPEEKQLVRDMFREDE